MLVVSPDIGGVVRARKFADMFNGQIAIVDKRRPEAGKSEVMNLIGEVKGKHAILVDDIVDSGGTLCNAAQALVSAGAVSVDAYVTHGVLSGSAVSRVLNSPLKNLVTTDSIQATEPIKLASNIRQISIATIPVTAKPKIGSGLSILSPPAKGILAWLHTHLAPSIT